MTSISDARISGLRAAMEPADPREVPAQFSRNEALAAAWLEAYDGISTALLNGRYGVMEAPARAERHTGDKEHTSPKKPKTATSPIKPKAEIKPTMMAILEEQFAEQP
jgi:hypothetical protein